MATEDTELQKGMIDPNSTQAADQTRYVLTGLFVCLFVCFSFILIIIKECLLIVKKFLNKT